MKLDLHIHTQYSIDFLISLDNLSKVCQQKNIDCIAITDHNTIEGALRLQDKASFPIIVGEEIRTREEEVIGLFIGGRLK